MISIQTNVNSLVAQQNLSVTSAFQSKTIQQLTSGYRINQAGDDAAGLAVANKFRSSVAELTQGVANGNDAVAQLQIMDGGMSNIGQILDRLKTLATQSSSGTFTGNRATLNSEFQNDIAEIDRQAQSIGLDTGGTFAKSLSVYLGQGSGSGDGNGGSLALNNASVAVDLSRATVDSGSLGLKGLKAIAGTVDAAGTDIGTGSSNGTTVQDIVGAKAGNAQAKAGYATFSFSGPGFSDNSKVAVAVNMSGVSDTNSLVTAINTAIGSAGNGSSQADQALKGAGIVATVNTDQFGHQQLAFSSSNTAFQVQAGDQMANALMGNFATAGNATGKTVTSSVTGGTAGVSTAAFNPTNVSVQVSGAGLAGPVNLKLSLAAGTVSAATGDVINQVMQSKQLQDAGISVSMTTDNKLQFTSATGANFNVASVGDSANALGLGTFVTTSALNGAASYSDITAGASVGASATGNGVATLAFSLNGGVTGGITAATVTGSVTGLGYTAGGTVGNAAGALGSMTLAFNGSATPVTVNFALDANRSGTETVQQAADFINSQIQAQAGYGSDVKLATVDSATKSITISGLADGAGTVVAAGSAAGKLGLTAVSGANIVAASGSAGNTISVNLAGGDATSAVATGTAAAPVSVATGSNTLALKIDGVAVNADFAKDVNGAGKAAAFTSTTLGVDAASTLDVSSLQGGKATLTGGVVGSSGTASTLDLAGFAAAKAAVTGSAKVVGSGALGVSAGVDLTGFKATAATFTGTSLGTANPALASLNLASFAATAAKVTGGSVGTSGITLVGAGTSLDVTQYGAKNATATSTLALGSSALDFSAFKATSATMSGTAVAAGSGDMTPVLSALGTSNKLTITIGGTAGATGTIDISTATDLAGVASKINGDATLSVAVTATAVNGVLTLTSKTADTGTANTIKVVANAASQAVGLSTVGQIPDSTTAGLAAKTLDLNIDGVTKSIDFSGAIDKTGVLAAINDNVKGFAGSATEALGVITITGSSATSATGKVNIVNNAASQALGLTSGIADNIHIGKDATKLKLNIDGLGEKDVDISGAGNLTDIATAINTAVGGGYVGANIVGGSLELSSTVKGTSGTVNIANNAVSRALKLTTIADIAQTGAAETKLQLNVDGHQVDVSVSSGMTNLSDIATAINAAAVTAGIAGYAGATESGTVVGALKLDSVQTGKTGALAGSVTVVDNAVSQKLKLTSGTDVKQTGVDATTLNLKLDSGQEVDIDLSTLATGRTVDQVLTAINSAMAAATAKGYDGRYDNVATATAGVITLTGVTSGGGITITNNAMSKALGLASGVSDTVNSGAAQTLKLQLDGKQEANIDLSGLGANAKLSDIATAINTALSADTAHGYGAAYGNVATAKADGTISLAGVAGGGTLTLSNSKLSNALGLTSNTSGASNTGSAAYTLGISIDGKATTQVSFSGITGGGTPKLSDIAAAINTALSNDTTNYGAAYANVASANADGTITMSSLTKGTTAGSVTVTNDTAGKALGLTSGLSASTTVKGKDESLADAVSFLNTTAQQALGTSSAAKIVTLDANGSVVISSQTKGANSSVSVVGAGTTGGLAASLQLGSFVDSATAGQGRSQQSVVDSLQQSFNGNATLQQAGLTAQINQGTNSLEIKSSNGTDFRIDAWGTKTGTTDSDLGFGDTGKAFTNALIPNQSSSSAIETQGASAIGTSANGTHNTTSITFQNMQFGNDDQSITIAANSAAGVAQTPLTITLQNDSEAKTGASIDAAISSINSKLQQSGNATLRSITAVQETGADGKESINFISSLSSFSVSTSSSAGASVGDGLNGGNAKTFTSAMNGGASSIAIDTQSGAQQAVTALGGAIAKLGTAQASIGRGENQLTYAISLATSQITNFSAAESAIRDTNVAQQAANLSKAQTLSQASIAAMAQANSSPQAVLSLLRG